MTDNVYLKQLEALGIESVRIKEVDPKKQQSADEVQAMKTVVEILMGKMEGRQWIYSKLNLCGVFTAPVVPGDPYGTHLLAGMQAVGHNLLNDVMLACPEQFYLMVQEAAARRQTS